MKLQDVYEQWLRQSLWADYVDNKPIKNIKFSSYIGEGSPDLNDSDFSTFAGVEVWSIDLDYEDGTTDYINLYDSDPITYISRYVIENNIKIEFEPEKEPTQEEILEGKIRSQI
jgi:hypothetical protein